jgi:preprotein translocase subunit SecG
MTMWVLTVLLTAVEIVTSLLLVILILMQKTKSQGMGMAFGGAMGETLFGAQVGNVLTRLTVILGIVFLLNTTLLAMLGGRRDTTTVVDKVSSAPMHTVPAVPPVPQQGM